MVQEPLVSKSPLSLNFCILAQARTIWCFSHFLATWSLVCAILMFLSWSFFHPFFLFLLFVILWCWVVHCHIVIPLFVARSTVVLLYYLYPSTTSLSFIWETKQLGFISPLLNTFISFQVDPRPIYCRSLWLRESSYIDHEFTYRSLILWTITRRSQRPYQDLRLDVLILSPSGIRNHELYRIEPDIHRPGVLYLYTSHSGFENLCSRAAPTKWNHGGPWDRLSHPS